MWGRGWGDPNTQAPLIFIFFFFPLPWQSSAAFWQGATGRRSLQRVTAVAFPSAQDLADWQQVQDEAALRDHRRIGRVSPMLVVGLGGGIIGGSPATPQ